MNVENNNNIIIVNVDNNNNIISVNVENNNNIIIVKCDGTKVRRQSAIMLTVFTIVNIINRCFNHVAYKLSP